jgi:putative NIF3 family GTP cyclohydrolase 1 type 2
MTTRAQLNDYYQALLRPETYADYCPNGLQVEGAEQIGRIAFAVPATRDSIHQAVANCNGTHTTLL